MYKVVIVDDEDIIVNGLKQVVPWSEYSCEVVATASDARGGTAMIKEHCPDILFTDIKMPGEDGLTMLAGIKAEYPDMEVTVLTGHREFEYAQQAIQIGVRRFLLKPSKMNELEEAVKVMTEKLKSREPKEADEKPEDDEAQSTSEPKDSEASSFIVKSALKYISEHYAEKLSLPELADKIYVSQWYLSKLINKYTGSSFYDLVNKTRIEKAKELLKNPSLKIHEISDEVGFNDVAHFSRIFKKLEDVSPKEYRNRYS